MNEAFAPTRSLPGTRFDVGVVSLVAVYVLGALHNFAGIALCGLLLLSQMSRHSIRLDVTARAILVATAVVVTSALLPLAAPFSVRIEEAARFLGLAAFATYLTSIRKNSAHSALVVISAILIATAVLYVIFGVFGRIASSGQHRFQSFTPHANHLAYACAMIALYLCHVGPQRFRCRLCWLALVLGMLFLIILTRSSGGIFVVTVGIVVIAVRRARGLARFAVFSAIPIAIFALLQVDVFSDGIKKILVTDFNETQRRALLLNFGDQGSSFAWRLSYWQAMLAQQVRDGWASILFGYGGGSTSSENRLLPFMRHDPHSDVVKLIFEYGIVGGSIIMAAIMQALWRSRAPVLLLIMFIGSIVAGNSIGSMSVMCTLLLCARAVNADRTPQPNRRRAPGE